MVEKKEILQQFVVDIYTKFQRKNVFVHSRRETFSNQSPFRSPAENWNWYKTDFQLLSKRLCDTSGITKSTRECAFFVYIVLRSVLLLFNISLCINVYSSIRSPVWSPFENIISGGRILLGQNDLMKDSRLNL
jgi:hypothetical protein